MKFIADDVVEMMSEIRVLPRQPAEFRIGDDDDLPILKCERARYTDRREPVIVIVFRNVPVLMDQVVVADAGVDQIEHLMLVRQRACNFVQKQCGFTAAAGRDEQVQRAGLKSIFQNQFRQKLCSFHVSSFPSSSIIIILQAAQEDKYSPPVKHPTISKGLSDGLLTCENLHNGRQCRII